MWILGLRWVITFCVSQIFIKNILGFPFASDLAEEGTQPQRFAYKENGLESWTAEQTQLLCIKIFCSDKNEKDHENCAKKTCQGGFNLHSDFAKKSEESKNVFNCLSEKCSHLSEAKLRMCIGLNYPKCFAVSRASTQNDRRFNGENIAEEFMHKRMFYGTNDFNKMFGNEEEMPFMSDPKNYPQDMMNQQSRLDNPFIPTDLFNSKVWSKLGEKSEMSAKMMCKEKCKIKSNKHTYSTCMKNECQTTHKFVSKRWSSRMCMESYCKDLSSKTMYFICGQKHCNR